MAEKIDQHVENDEKKPLSPVNRLCNEIQLFDLCELDKCGYKKGLYCTDTDLLNRFDAISEEDEGPAVSGYPGEEDDDTLEFDGDEYEDTQFVDEGYEEDHEDE